MKLTETGKLWGNFYNRYYFLDGRRITESYANLILKEHAYEDLGQERIQSGWRKTWNIGPRLDSMYDLYDHPDMT